MIKSIRCRKNLFGLKPGGYRAFLIIELWGLGFKNLLGLKLGGYRAFLVVGLRV